MKLFRLVLAIGLACVFGADAYAQTFTRHCDGKIELRYQDNATGGQSKISINHLSGRGKGWTIGKARKDARNRIHDCYADHWQFRWDFYDNTYSFSIAHLPNSCRSSRIKNYHGGDVDIKSNIEYAVWDNYLKSVDPQVLVNGGVTVGVYAVSSGGGVIGACDRTRHLSNYTVKRSWFVD
ncbi:MAG: hypothetical protein HRU19_27570 [Pseudobacteriovorax sp.]|nr:hypothetical protein [Pseudobacteriovorax sp.]